VDCPAIVGVGSKWRCIVNRIIWMVGAVVIVLFVLGYFGLR
jgi:hypothetical protein